VFAVVQRASSAPTRVPTSKEKDMTNVDLYRTVQRSALRDVVCCGAVLAWSIACFVLLLARWCAATHAALAVRMLT
jgi:hypothetical protein